MNTSVPTPEKSLSHQVHTWLRSKKMWSAVVIFLLLLVIGGLVPVGKIPFLRNLVYAMGYSPDEAQRISFLKALFSWNEHSKIMRGEVPDPDELTVFGARGGAFNSTLDPAKNKLIDIQSVNASLAKSGKKGDYVRGVYDTSGTRSASGTQNKTAVSLTNNNATANTQANGVTQKDVLFGRDASAIIRDKNDAFDSVNTLKKVQKLPIAGVSKGTDWFDRSVDRALKGEANLAEFFKGRKNSNTMQAQIGKVGRAGNTRAQRDMYWAWMMGRVARRTPQVLLKKTLASASFDGAELPRSVFSASGFGGVAINAEKMNTDITDVQKYLEQDKNCENALKQAGQQMDTAMIARQIDSLANSFPATCGDLPGTYMTQLQGIANGCQQMKSAYESARQVCGTLSLVIDENQCHFETLTAYYTAFVSFCQAELEKCALLADEDATKACIAAAKGLSSSQDYSECEAGCPSYNKTQLEGADGEVKGTLYTESGGFNPDFFPSVNWGKSINVHQDSSW